MKNRVARYFRGDELYDAFERIVSYALVFLISLVILYSVVVVAIEIFYDFRVGPGFLEKEGFQDVMGPILNVLILLEINYSIVSAMRAKSGAVQVRIVVLIAILAIARKLILLDYKAAGAEILLGLGALSLSLGALYWLLADGDQRRRRPPNSTAPSADAAPPEGRTPG